MNSIPISQIVAVPANVISAGSAAAALDSLLVSQSSAVPPGQVLSFFDAAAVADFFGPGSAEARFAAGYFPGIENGGRLPASLRVGRYTTSSTGAGVYGAPLDLPLIDLQALTGRLVVVTSAEFESDPIDLSGATSFADAATLIEAAFEAPDFEVEYDAWRRRFRITTSATGVQAEIHDVSGSLAPPLGLSVSSGAYVQESGTDADTAGTAMQRIRGVSAQWCGFTLAWETTALDRLEFAAWTAGTDAEFFFVGWGVDEQALVVGDTNSFGAQLYAAGLSGTIPVFGDVTNAAAVLAWSAATNYDLVEGRTTLAFRRAEVAPAVVVKTEAAAEALISNNYTYYGLYAGETAQYQIFYPGNISGPFRWADSFQGQVWLRRLIRENAFNALRSFNSLPYNQDGYSAIYQATQSTITQGLANGVIRAGVALSPAQAARINSQAGANIANEVATLGWFVQVRDPLNPGVREDRGSPLINLWYCDGGSIQRLTIPVTAIL